MVAELPAFENERLREIEQLRMLERPLDRDISDLLELCRQMLGADSCAFNLITKDEQVEKFVAGNSMGNFKRDNSLCQHVVYANKPLTVPNTRTDARCKGYDIVLNHPKIAAYAGVPVRSANNLPLGVLCVTFGKPRQVSDQEVESLKLFGQVFRRRLIPGISAEAMDGVPTNAVSSDAFFKKLNQLLVKTRKGKKEKTVLSILRTRPSHRQTKF